MLLKYLSSGKDLKGGGILIYCVAVSLLIWVPSSILTLTWEVYRLPGSGVDVLADTSYKMTLFVLFVAPLLETLLLRFLITLLEKIIKSMSYVLAVNAVLWWPLHYGNSAYGLYAIWMFYIMGYSYVAIRRKSHDRALLMVVIIHFLVNLYSFLLAPLAREWVV